MKKSGTNSGWRAPLGLTVMGLIMSSACLAQTAAAPDLAVQVERVWSQKPFIETTACAGDIGAIGKAGEDPDIVVPEDATVFVMMHGNRFVAAKELAAAFEVANPGERVAYTAIPPFFTVKALQEGSLDVGLPKRFRPDVVLAPPAVVANLAARPFKTLSLKEMGLYSRVHGLVLMARADDKRVSGSDWKAVVRTEGLRLSLPGQQVPGFTTFGPLVEVLGEAGLDERLKNGMVGGTQVRHHRSMPARIASGCEDIGIQFLQSQQFWEQERPGVFKFLDVPISDDDSAKDESRVYLVVESKRQAAAARFAAFLVTDVAKEILKKYRLEP